MTRFKCTFKNKKINIYMEGIFLLNIIFYVMVVFFVILFIFFKYADIYCEFNFHYRLLKAHIKTWRRFYPIIKKRYILILTSRALFLDYTKWLLFILIIFTISLPFYFIFFIYWFFKCLTYFWSSTTSTRVFKIDKMYMYIPFTQLGYDCYKRNLNLYKMKKMKRPFLVFAYCIIFTRPYLLVYGCFYKFLSLTIKYDTSILWNIRRLLFEVFVYSFIENIKYAWKLAFSICLDCCYFTHYGLLNWWTILIKRGVYKMDRHFWYLPNKYIYKVDNTFYNFKNLEEGRKYCSNLLCNKKFKKRRRKYRSIQLKKRKIFYFRYNITKIK